MEATSQWLPPGVQRHTVILHSVHLDNTGSQTLLLPLLLPPLFVAIPAAADASGVVAASLQLLPAKSGKVACVTPA